MRDHATYPLTFWHICSWTAQHLLGVGITPRLGIVTLVQSLVHEATNNTRNDEILLQVKLAQLTHKQSPNLSLAYLNLFRSCVSKPWRAYIRHSFLGPSQVWVRPKDAPCLVYQIILTSSLTSTNIRKISRQVESLDEEECRKKGTMLGRPLSKRSKKIVKEL